ncbi:MAG: hypothetical protein R3C68_02805 [Myxococcota bacterium]
MSNFNCKYRDFFDRRRLLLRLACISVVVVVDSNVAFAQHALDSLLPGHWMELSLNTLNDVVATCDGGSTGCRWTGSTGPSSIMSAWCGGAFATAWGSSGGLIAYGGGHQDYFGNEVYIFDIETRLWQRLSDPYDDGVTNPTINACSSTGSYPDGSPCATHTYDGVDYHPASNSFVVFNSELDANGGSSSGYPFLFDLDSRSWRRGPKGSGSGIGPSSAYDPTRGILWLRPWAASSFRSFDPEANGGAGEWTQYGTTDYIDIDATAAIDPIADLYVMLDTRDASPAFRGLRPGLTHR